LEDAAGSEFVADVLLGSDEMAADALETALLSGTADDVLAAA